MAYLKELIPRRCTSCRKPAKFELVNARNAVIAVYCAACGRRALARFKKIEEGQMKNN